MDVGCSTAVVGAVKVPSGTRPAYVSNRIIISSSIGPGAQRVLVPSDGQSFSINFYFTLIRPKNTFFIPPPPAAFLSFSPPSFLANERNAAVFYSMPLVSECVSPFHYSFAMAEWVDGRTEEPRNRERKKFQLNRRNSHC